jgi:hypothetical protein
MKLYWAEHIRERGMGITHALPFNRFFLCHPNKDLWENATIEDWEFLDNTCNGELFKHYYLVECPEGTELTNMVTH